MKHAVSLLEVVEGRVLPLGDDFVKASNLEKAKQEVTALVERRGFNVRTISYATDGKILAYVVRKGPQRRKRYIAASALRAK